MRATIRTNVGNEMFYTRQIDRPTQGEILWEAAEEASRPFVVKDPIPNKDGSRRWLVYPIHRITSVVVNIEE